MMPRFFKDMPAPEPGPWVSVVKLTNAFGYSREIWAREVTGLRRAYIAARLMALWEDLWCPYYDGEVGIEWAIRKGK